MKKEKKEFEKLIDIITGEKKLRDKEREILEKKKNSLKEAKQKRRKNIVEGNIKIEKDEEIEEKKIVQNIKLYEWTAPDRYQFKYNSKAFLIVTVTALVFSLLLAILGNYLLMAAILSLLFFLYIAGTTKPINIKHMITARGVETVGKLYEWYMLDSFFFSKKDDTYFLIVESKLNFPKVLIMLLNEKEKDVLFVLLQEKLLYKDSRKWSWIDKITYGEYIPLEKV